MWRETADDLAHDRHEHVWNFSARQIADCFRRAVCVRDPDDDDAVVDVAGAHHGFEYGGNANVRAGSGLGDYVHGERRGKFAGGVGGGGCSGYGDEKRNDPGGDGSSGETVGIFAGEICGRAAADGMLRGDDVRIELFAGVDGWTTRVDGFMDTAGVSDGEVRNLRGNRDGCGDAGTSGVELGVYFAAGSGGDVGGAERRAYYEGRFALVEHRLVLRVAVDAIFVGRPVFEYQAGDAAANGLGGTFDNADIWRGLCAGGAATGDVVVSLSKLEAGLKQFAAREACAAAKNLGWRDKTRRYTRNRNRSEEAGWSADAVGQIGRELLKVANVEDIDAVASGVPGAG